MKFNWKFFGYLFLLMLTIGISQAQNKKTDKFINNYMDVALLNVNRGKKMLLKWEGKDTLKYRIYGKFQYLGKNEWINYLTEIGQLINKTIISTDSKDFDIILFFGTLRDYSIFTRSYVPNSVVSKYGYWNDYNWNKQYQLIYASGCIDPSMISSKNEGGFLVKKQFLRTLGIIGVIDDRFSLLHEKGYSSNKKLSRLDKRLIKLHYHDSIKTGLNTDDLKTTVKSISNLEEFS